MRIIKKRKVRTEQKLTAYEDWADLMVGKAEVREPLANGKQVSEQTLKDIARHAASKRVRMRANVILANLRSVK
jgi:hypothetical protein